MMLKRGFELMLENLVSLGHFCIDIAVVPFKISTGVADFGFTRVTKRTLVIFRVLMHRIGRFSDRLINSEYCRQLFVFNLDQPKGSLSNIGIVRRYRRNPVTDKTNFIAGQHR